VFSLAIGRNNRNPKEVRAGGPKKKLFRRSRKGREKTDSARIGPKDAKPRHAREIGSKTREGKGMSLAKKKIGRPDTTSLKK